MAYTEEQLKSLVEGSVKNVVDTYLKDQLKEQMTEAVNAVKAQMKPDPVIVEADTKAQEFKTFREFLVSVRNFRMNRTLDERLTFIAGTGTKTTGHMEIGEDSQGGYEPNAHVKSCYMPETL